MPYPERFLIPMREDLTRFGVEETRTPEEVDQNLPVWNKIYKDIFG